MWYAETFLHEDHDAVVSYLVEKIIEDLTVPHCWDLGELELSYGVLIFAEDINIAQMSKCHQRVRYYQSVVYYACSNIIFCVFGVCRQ